MQRLVKFTQPLDACAQPFNTKCTRFFTPQKDGLSQSWEGERVFCCPPSGTRELRLWTKKALEEAVENGNFGDEPSVNDVAEYMGVSDRTVRDRIKEHGGYVIEDGIVRKKECGKD